MTARILTVVALFCSAVLSASIVRAQGTRADYEYASTYDERTRDRVFRDKITPNWIDADHFWYRVETGQGTHEFVLVNVTKGERRPAFDHGRLSTAISEKTDLGAQPDRLPFREISFPKDFNSVSFRAGGSQWKCDLEHYQLEPIKPVDAADETIQDGVRVLESLQPSGASQDETHVEFVNRTETPIELFWVEPSGRRRRYARIDTGETHRQHTFAGHVWLATQNGQPVAAFAATASDGTAIIDGTQPTPKGHRTRGRNRRRQERSQRELNGNWRARIVDHNVVLEATPDDAKLVQLTFDGTAEDPYTNRFHWSPDGKKLVVMQVRAGEVHEIHMVESAPKNQVQPQLHKHNYTKPGDRIDHPRPRLLDVASRTPIEVSDELFPNPWSIQSLRWSDDSQRFTFVYNQRGHQVLRVISVDAQSGEVTAIVDEQSKTFIDYAGKFFHEELPDTDEIVWMSERDGWNHLYLIDSTTGEVKGQITRGNWVVRRVERVDSEARQIWFTAGGIFAEQDPYHLHLCRVNFDGSDLTVLTASNGTHQWEFSPGNQFIVDTWSRVDQPNVTELRRTSDGSLVCELERADDSRLRETGWQPPEPFVAKGRDGETDIYGIIVRPTNFNPIKKYPVIEKIYAGPHSAHVPKRFSRQSNNFTLADIGFIVVQIDGMGTSHRRKAFHDVCWQNLSDAGFADRIAWMKAAAEKYPEMDISRVGIYGGSAGGQNALGGLLTHGDFYKVGAADCGCHDNRMDKIWWNELWMGWPVGDHYAENSNVTHAHRLRGKLLLTVGELDRNVDPASTMQVVDALIKADKDFDLLVVPGAGHGVGERPYAKRRRTDFFVRHLWGAEPRR